MNNYYDIKKIEKGYEIDLIKENVVNKRENEKIKSSVIYDVVDIFQVDNLEEAVKKLQYAGFKCFSRVVPEEYTGVIINSPKLKLKLMYLRNKIKLLEKIYDFVIIDNVNYLVTYITYINMEDGLEHALYLGNMGVAKERNIKMLKDNGYKFINQSNLMDYINDLAYNRKLVLNKKEPKI